MLDIYSDITLKDVEMKQLKRSGLLKEKDIANKEKKPLKIKICTKCKYSNSPISKFCNKCGRMLDSRTILEVEAKQKLSQKIDENFIENEILKELKAMKKIWHAILNAIAWITQYNARLRKTRRRNLDQEIEIQRLRSRRWG